MRLLALSAIVVVFAACAGGDEPIAGPPVTTAPPATASASPPPAPPSVARSETPHRDVRLQLETVVDGLDQPLIATAPAGDERLFVGERVGVVRIVRDGEVVREPFLDIRGRVRVGGEFGLLGMAFHPDFPRESRVFVHYSEASNGATTISAFQLSDDADRVDPGSEQVLLTVPQPASNHNGGTIAFGPDGYLFIALGDGGGGGDTYGNGQDPSTLLGTLLRIDVDGVSQGRQYAIPPDNPFADGQGGAPEVWAYGLRNPYRFSFDDGRVYIGDVGQSDREEIDIEPADAAGLNYGWPIMEGATCFRSADCDRTGLTLPAVDYVHDGRVCGVIGGHVYRGSDEAFRGTYLYGDLCAGWVRSFRYLDGEVTDHRDRTEELGLEVGDGYGLLSFGRDGNGEVYVLTASAVHRVVPR